MASSGSTSTPDGPSLQIQMTREQAQSWHFGLTDTSVAYMGEEFARELMNDPSLVPLFRTAALCAKYADASKSTTDDPKVAVTAIHEAGERVSMEEEQFLVREMSHRWSQPKKMYLVAISKFMHCSCFLNLVPSSNKRHSLFSICSCHGYGRDSGQRRHGLLQGSVWHCRH